MRKIVTFVSFFSASIGAAALTACLGDDTVFDTPITPGRDASFDATVSETGPAGDARAETGTEAGPAPPRLLLSYNGSSNSELVALNIGTGAVDGRLVYPSKFGTTYARGSSPFLLEQATDIVARLDDREPWKIVSTWNVRGSDGKDGGTPYADPAAVLVSAGNKAYVLRFNRNQIFVIDPSETADGGAPKKTIDLSSLVQAGDTDGIVEPVAGVYVASRKRLYVLLDNVDLSKVASDGFTYLCSSLKSSILAIDTDTDAVVSAGGAGPGGSILINAHNTPLGVDLFYDGTKDSLLVLGAGCNVDTGGGVAGAVTRRIVEEVALGSGARSTRLDLNAQGFPGGFQVASPTLAFIGFFGALYAWDPRTTTLGAQIPGNLESFVWDGKGTMYGTRTVFGADGGSTIEVVKTQLPIPDAGADAGPPVITIATDPFASPKGGFLNGAEIWPKP
jgi:hypothetical protein